MNKDELWEFVKQDTRSPNQIFEEMQQQMQEMSGNKLTDKESIEAVRNLTGFCEAIMGLRTGSKRNVEYSQRREQNAHEARDSLGV